MTRHLEFVEIINEKVMMLGWRSDQTNNFHKEVNLQSAACKEEIIRPSTGTARFTAEQLDKLKEELFKRYFDKMEALRMSRIGYQRAPEMPKVLAGKNFLQVELESAGQARKVQAYLEKIKSILRKEKAKEAVHQQWVNVKH